MINPSKKINTQKKLHKGLAGFTLMEVILSLSIFSVGIIVTLAVFPKGSLLGKEAQEITVATQLAQEKIEETIALGYDDIPVGEIEPKERVETNPESQFYNYQREVTGILVDADLNTSATDIGLKKIKVSVYWRENAQEKNIELVRLMNKP